MYVCVYKGWAIKFSPCTATFSDLLCLFLGLANQPTKYTYRFGLEQSLVRFPLKNYGHRDLPFVLIPSQLNVFHSFASCFLGIGVMLTRDYVVRTSF
jgi:hypothetical protein